MPKLPHSPSSGDDSHRPGVREHTRLSVRLDLADIPVEFEYDRDSGEVSAFNDDLRILAVGSTPQEAEQRFLEALTRWLQTEFRSGKGLPDPIREHVTFIDAPSPRRATRRGRLQPA
jgi:predicted RNase H-like HicB family nuclease